MARESLSDKEISDLVTRSQRGDKDSFDKIFESFAPFRNKVARRLCNSGIDNEDVRQEVDMQFCNAVMNYDPDKGLTPKGHLINFTKTRAYNAYRKQLRWLQHHRVHIKDRFSDLELLLDRFNILDDFLIEFENDSISSLDMISILKGLSSQESKIVFLRYYTDMTQEAIAEKIGIDQSNVSRELNDAHDRLTTSVAGGRL